MYKAYTAAVGIPTIALTATVADAFYEIPTAAYCYIMYTYRQHVYIHRVQGTCIVQGRSSIYIYTVS